MKRQHHTNKPNTTVNRNTNRPSDRRRNLAIRLSPLVMALALGASACSSDDSATTTLAPADESASTPTTAALAGGIEDRAAAGQGDDEAGGDGGITPTALPANLNRDIIFNADIAIAVNDVSDAGAEATQRIEALGGFLFGQQTTGGTNAQSLLIFKIIPEQFQTALEQLGSIGELRNQTVSADDVTERVVNLASQIATSEASVERLRALLDNAGTIDELTKLEEQLLVRETNLETLRGSLRTLRDQVALATITLRIEEARLRPDVEIIATAYPGFEDSGTSCPGSAESLTVDRGTRATLCFEIRNTGDTDLTGFQLTDTVLDITLEDVTIVDGDPAEALHPRQTLIVAYGVEVDRRTRTQTRLSATPVNSDGVRLEDRPAANTTSYTLRSGDPGGIPNFGEGLGRSFRTLVNLLLVGLLAIGLAIPFIWVPFAVFFGARWWRRRIDARATAPTTATSSPTPTREPAPDEPEPDATRDPEPETEQDPELETDQTGDNTS